MNIVNFSKKVKRDLQQTTTKNSKKCKIRQVMSPVSGSISVNPPGFYPPGAPHLIIR